MRVSPDFNRINANACVLSLMNGSIPQARLHIALFSGTPPTDDRLITMLTTASSVYWGGATIIAEWATSANLLADLNVHAVTSVVDAETMTWNLPLSVQAGQFVVAQAGTPTWFMARYTTSSAQGNGAFTDFCSGGIAQCIITGTVGDENSNAELKIVGGTVALNAPVRAADLRIKF